MTAALRENVKVRDSWEDDWAFPGAPPSVVAVPVTSTPAETPPKDAASLTYEDVLEPGMTAAEAIRALAEHAIGNGDLAVIWNEIVADARAGHRESRKIVLEYAVGKPTQTLNVAAAIRVRHELSPEDRAEIERVLLACYPEGQVYAQLPAKEEAGSENEVKSCPSTTAPTAPPPPPAAPSSPGVSSGRS